MSNFGFSVFRGILSTRNGKIAGNYVCIEAGEWSEMKEKNVKRMWCGQWERVNGANHASMWNSISAFMCNWYFPFGCQRVRECTSFSTCILNILCSELPRDYEQMHIWMLDSTFIVNKHKINRLHIRNSLLPFAAPARKWAAKKKKKETRAKKWESAAR